MNHNTPRHRRSIRLAHYDYSRAGAYFVTICIHGRKCLLGNISKGEMIPNEYGNIVMRYWDDLPNHYLNIELGEFVMMPNHIHGIIIINDKSVGAIHEPTNTVGAIHELPLQSGRGHELPLHIQRRKMLLPKIIGRFKMTSAKQINSLRNTRGIPVWQKNYYEHVIRNYDDYLHIATYIQHNPVQWELDEENPEFHQHRRGNS